jgi:hypothetical protein
MTTTHTPTTGKEMSIILPPGRYIFSDPCYTMSYDDYDAVWSPHGYESGILYDERGDLIMVVNRTAYGDGEYRVRVTDKDVSTTTRLGVDAGCFAVLNADQPFIQNGPDHVAFELTELAVYRWDNGLFTIDSKTFSLTIDTEYYA